MICLKEIVELTKDLISFKTTSDRPEELNRCASYIQNYLDFNGIPHKRYDFEGKPSICALPLDESPYILLMTHIDVVSGSDELFIPFEKDGSLYGRGSLDDKYAVALSLVLLKKFYKERTLGKRFFPAILITSDEEVGGKDGAMRMLAMLDPRFCIVLDGGDSRSLVIKEKGILHLKLVAEGVAAHGARPWLGKNAVENLFADYLAMKRMFPLTPPDYWHSTINLGVIKAGNSYNRVPDLAEAVLDIRYTESDDPGQLVEELKKMVQGRLEVLKIEPVFEAPDSPYLDLLHKIAPDLKKTREHGASDARHLGRYGIDGVVWGADGDLSQHSEDEHVKINSIAYVYGIIERFIDKAVILER